MMNCKLCKWISKLPKVNLKNCEILCPKYWTEKSTKVLTRLKSSLKKLYSKLESASKQIKKSLLERIKDLPVVQKVGELGTAGSVAVSTAAVAQTTVAIDQTEIFVASVANDVVEERFEVPGFIDTFIDFHELNDWGQVVLIEKVSEAQAFVESASEQLQTSTQSAESLDSKPVPSASSNNSSSEKSSQSDQPVQTDKSSEKQKTEQESKEESSSEEVKEDDLEKDKEGKQQQDPEQKTEDKKESQEKESLSETSTDSDDVKDLPIVETPFDNDSSVRQVSPTL
jgi:hypothetical protein